MKSTPKLPSEDHPALSDEISSYREEQSILPTEQTPSVVALAVMTGIIGLVIASTLNLNGGAGFIIGFLVGFLIFWIRLVVLESRTDKIKRHLIKAITSIPGDRSITIPCPECGAEITVTVTHKSSSPGYRKED